jgi:hypothetical protein
VLGRDGVPEVAVRGLIGLAEQFASVGSDLTAGQR